MNGGLEQTVRGRVTAGYAAPIAGGRYSLAMTWPEDHPTEQRIPMSAANQMPLFVWSTDSQPTTGTHLISRFPDRSAREIVALMEAPHLNTSWASDSGVLRIAVSDPRTRALAGTFDVWMRCTQRCPCAGTPCQAYVRGSFAVP
jgi:hypothetical protein